MTVWFELQEKAMMDAKLPLTCRDLAAFLSRSREKKQSLHREMKGQLVETWKVSFIEQRQMCHLEKGLAKGTDLLIERTG